MLVLRSLLALNVTQLFRIAEVPCAAETVLSLARTCRQIDNKLLLLLADCQQLQQMNIFVDSSPMRGTGRPGKNLWKAFRMGALRKIRA